MEANRVRSSVHTIMIVGSALQVGVLAWVGILIAYQGGDSESARSWFIGFGLSIFWDASDLLPAWRGTLGLRLRAAMFLLEGATLAGLLWLVWAPAQLFESTDFSLPWALFGLLVGLIILGLTRKFHQIRSTRHAPSDNPYTGSLGGHGYFGSPEDK